MLHKPARDRINEICIDGDDLLATFEQMAQDAATSGQDSIHWAVEFLEADDKFEVGTYVPEVILILRKVVEDESDRECDRQHLPGA